MSLKFFNRLWKTLGFRLTLWYAVVFIVSSLTVFVFAYFHHFSTVQRKEGEIIQSKLSEYAARYHEEGIDAIREVSLERYTNKPVRFLIRVAGTDNNTLFLSVPDSWPNFDLQRLQTREVKETRGWIYLKAKDDEDMLEIGSILLHDGNLLQVGKSTEDWEELLENFLLVFASIMTPLILLSLIGGIFLAFRALRPLRSFISTINVINQTGRIDARVPRRHTGDEFDELGCLFNSMLDKIESLIKGMRAVLDNAAHDIRTPMTRLRGVAEMALQSHRSHEASQEALADCLEESERVLTILNTLMDISEAETGLMRLHFQTVDVSEVIENVVELYRDVAADKQITISTVVPKELCLPADYGRLQQVLANLLDNAIKYTPDSGRVEIAAHQRQQQVVVRVEDTGVGISPDELPKIWDRLYRGDQSRSQRGLGLGLSLVKATVQAHGGLVEVTSIPQTGSLFVIYLPLTR